MVKKEINSLSEESISKYTKAADIVNRTITALLAASKENAKILDICVMGDKLLNDAIKAVPITTDKEGKKSKNGIVFPTCVNVNNVICNFSPLESDTESSRVLKKGDVVKIAIGAHVDGYPAVVGHTFVVGSNKEHPVTGYVADCIASAHAASEAVLKLLKPGHTNEDVSNAVQKIAHEFETIPVSNMMCSELVQHEFEGEKKIILNRDERTGREKAAEFKVGEVWMIDVFVVKSSDGSFKSKPKASELRTNIYRRMPNMSYSLKMATSRKVLSEVSNTYGYMPFHLRGFKEQAKTKLGLKECITHRLVTPYEVIEEPEGSVVAQFMYTALVLADGTVKRISNGPAFDKTVIKSSKVLSEEKLAEILSTK